MICSYDRTRKIATLIHDATHTETEVKHEFVDACLLELTELVLQHELGREVETFHSQIADTEVRPGVCLFRSSDILFLKICCIEDRVISISLGSDLNRMVEIEFISVLCRDVVTCEHKGVSA